MSDNFHAHCSHCGYPCHYVDAQDAVDDRSCPFRSHQQRSGPRPHGAQFSLITPNPVNPSTVEASRLKYSKSMIRRAVIRKVCRVRYIWVSTSSNP